MQLQQKYAKDLNVTLGCDFVEALKFVESESEREISLYLVDRRVSVTMGRVMTSMKRWGRLKFALDLAWNLVKSQFER